MFCIFLSYRRTFRSYRGGLCTVCLGDGSRRRASELLMPHARRLVPDELSPLLEEPGETEEERGRCPDDQERRGPRDHIVPHRGNAQAERARHQRHWRWISHGVTHEEDNHVRNHRHG